MDEGKECAPIFERSRLSRFRGPPMPLRRPFPISPYIFWSAIRKPHPQSRRDYKPPFYGGIASTVLSCHAMPCLCSIFICVATALHGIRDDSTYKTFPANSSILIMNPPFGVPDLTESHSTIACRYFLQSCAFSKG